MINNQKQLLIETAEKLNEISDKYHDLLLADRTLKKLLIKLINQAEKLEVIDDANVWMGIRALRNISVHDYTEKDLSQFFIRLKQEAPRLLQLKEKLNATDPS